MGGARRALLFVALTVSVLSAATADSADYSPLVRGGAAAIPFESECGRDGVGVLTARGHLRRFVLPGKARGLAAAAAGEGGFAVAWRSRGNRAMSARLDPVTGFAPATDHGPMRPRTESIGPQVAVDQAGRRAVLWEDDHGIRLQRVDAAGESGPVLLVRMKRGPEVEDQTGLSPTLQTSGDILWVTWHDPAYDDEEGYKQPQLVARRVSADDSMGSENDLFRPAVGEYVAHAQILGTAPDGRDGLFALIGFDDDDSDTMDPSGGGPATRTLRVSHLSSSGGVTHRRVAGLNGGHLDGRLAPVAGGAEVVYNVIRRRRSGIFGRTFDATGRLGRPRLLRREPENRERNHFVADVAGGPRAAHASLLLTTPFRSTERLFLQRRSHDGGLRRIQRVADAGRYRSGEGAGLSNQRLALDGRGRAYLTWSRGADLADAAYARVVRGGRQTPVRALWRCPGLG